jgi:hypothetical protein
MSILLCCVHTVTCIVHILLCCGYIVTYIVHIVLCCGCIVTYIVRILLYYEHTVMLCAYCYHVHILL